MRNSSVFARYSTKTSLSGSFGQPYGHGSLPSRQSSLALPWGLTQSPGSSSSSQGGSIMQRATAVLERMMWLWIVLLSVSVAQVAYWWFDRAPPFSVTSYSVAPVYQGGYIHIDAIVKHDLTRECSVTLSNNLYDSSGSRYLLEPPVRLQHGAIAAVDRKTPGRMVRNMPLPEGVAVGPAALVSSMAYECNLLQELVRPISVQIEFLFEVLP